MTPVTIYLPWPDSALHAHAKGHWRPKAAATKAYRCMAWHLAQQAGVKRNPAARLAFTFHPPDKRRRDCQNMPAMMKGAVDGIADAMGCDDHLFRCAWPEAFAEPALGGVVIVNIGEAI